MLNKSNVAKYIIRIKRKNVLFCKGGLHLIWTILRIIEKKSEHCIFSD